MLVDDTPGIGLSIILNGDEALALAADLLKQFSGRSPACFRLVTRDGKSVLFSAYTNEAYEKAILFWKNQEIREAMPQTLHTLLDDLDQGEK